MKDTLYFVSKAVGLCVDPLTPFLILFIIAIYSYFKKKNLLKWIAAVATAYLFFITSPIIPLLANWYEEDEVNEIDSSPSDALVVLGVGHLSFDQHLQQFRLGQHAERYIEGIRLFKRGAFNYFIASGGDIYSLKSDTIGEATSLKKLAMEWGIPPEKIMVKDQSFTTYQEAIELKQVAEKYHLKTVTIVTSAFHMKRASKIFEQQGFKIKKYPVDLVDHSGWTMANIGLWTRLTKEWFGLIGLYFYRKNP